MKEIILKKRYPHSREEDITDAFMRGYETGKEQEHRWWSTFCANCKTEPTISKMEQVEDEPTHNQHVQRVEYVGNDEKSRCWTCKHFERMYETPISSDGSYYTYVVCTAKECEYEPKDEPQTESTGSPIGDYRDGVGAWQTDCPWK